MPSTPDWNGRPVPPTDTEARAQAAAKPGLNPAVETPRPETVVTDDPWGDLKRFTEARIALGRSGVSLPLREHLAFRLDHARARDAVHAAFSAQAFADRLGGAGIPAMALTSAAESRTEYLARPDKGRRLSKASRARLERSARGYDIALVLSDGLSSRAMDENAVPFAQTFLHALEPTGLTLAPVCVVQNGRVAIADEIGALFETRLAIILIGERPGLSSPNSMGVYLTWNPRPGTTDESRNCISNVRRGGLSILDGVRKLSYLVEEALRMRLSGVGLKDLMSPDYLPFGRELDLGLEE